jgi:hypothetical protein
MTSRPDEIDAHKMDKAMKDFLPRNPPSPYRCGCGINRHKKSPSCGHWHEGLHPAFLALSLYYRTPSIGGLTAFNKAGLLALGSSYSLRLPVSVIHKTVASADFVPDYSGGTAPDSNGISYQALPGAYNWVSYPKGSFLSNAKNCFSEMAILSVTIQAKRYR